MTRTIHVPPGEEGDEAVKRIIPSIWKMASSEADKNRSTDGVD